MPGRRGGGRGRAGFVPSLPPKPNNWKKAVDELSDVVNKVLGDKGHVGWGYSLEAGADPSDPKFKQPMAPEAEKRPGSWTLFVWTDASGPEVLKLPAAVGGIPVRIRGIPVAY